MPIIIIRFEFAITNKYIDAVFIIIFKDRSGTISDFAICLALKTNLIIKNTILY